MPRAPASRTPVPYRGKPPSVSPLLLSDRMLGLAQDADRAGLVGTAQALLSLACAILDDPPAPMAVAHGAPGAGGDRFTPC